MVAITLAAGLQATGALTRAATRQSDQWLAQLCAENELTRLRLARQLPGVGETSADCTQVGQTLAVRLVSHPRPTRISGASTRRWKVRSTAQRCGC